MLRTGQLLRLASTPASRPKPEASLPGTLASPRTGLSPAGHRELVARLRHDHSSAFMTSELLDARGSRLIRRHRHADPGRSRRGRPPAGPPGRQRLRPSGHRRGVARLSQEPRGASQSSRRSAEDLGRRGEAGEVEPWGGWYRDAGPRTGRRGEIRRVRPRRALEQCSSGMTKAWPWDRKCRAMSPSSWCRRRWRSRQASTSSIAPAPHRPGQPRSPGRRRAIAGVVLPPLVVRMPPPLVLATTPATVVGHGRRDGGEPHQRHRPARGSRNVRATRCIHHGG
jgi:hypothetical protein